jgi:hypothetical protein
VNQFQYGRRFIEPRQRYRRWIDPRVASLRVADVAAYLRQRGWKEVTPDRPHCRVFEEPGTPPGQDPFYQFLPDPEHYADYGQQMFDLLTGLAEFEDRHASAVIDDVLELAGQEQQGNGNPAGHQPDAEKHRPG